MSWTDSWKIIIKINYQQCRVWCNWLFRWGKSLWGSDLIPRQSYSNWLPGTPFAIEISLTGTDIRLWVSNYIHMNRWGVITQILPDLNDDLFKPPLQLGRGWVIQPTWNYITYPHPKLNWYLLSKGPLLSSQYGVQTNCILVLWCGMIWDISTLSQVWVYTSASLPTQQRTISI